MVSTADLIDPKAGLWFLLAVTLRILRKQHRMSQAAVGVLVSADHKTVSSWEAARYKPPEDALRILDDEWNTGGLLGALHHYAQTVQEPTEFMAFSDCEADATVIRLSAVAWVPGLFQTPEYAKSAIQASGQPDVEKGVTDRLARQKILRKPNPPDVFALLDEAVLLRIPAELAKAQLDQLLELSELPHVTIRIVSWQVGLHVGMDGQFQLFRTVEREVGWVETSARGRLITESDDLRRLAVAFEKISSVALSPDATRARIREMLEALA